MKRILIITYYWPPSGGGGVMRWLKMSKYLPGLGWQPVIYTPDNSDPSVLDESLEKEIPPEAEIIRRPIWEPYDLYRRFTGKKKEAKLKAGFISEASRGNWKEKLSVFIRGNILIPDPRKFWVNPSVHYLRTYLKNHPVDVMVSTGPPHSMHLIALRLKKYFDLPWLADFRDPWTNIDFYDRLKLTRWADNKHKYLENRVLKKADYVVTVSESWAHDFERLSGRKIEVITNGFDPEDFNMGEIHPENCFSITHIGSFNQDRNPEKLWQALQIIGNERPHFFKHLKIRLIGQTDPKIIESLSAYGLSEFVEEHGYMAHNKSLEYLKQSQILLLPLNNTPNVTGIIPGKFYEYLAVGRPILAVGPEAGDCGNFLRQTNAGEICDFENMISLKFTVLRYFNLYLENNLILPSGTIERFSRRNLARQLVDLIEK